MKALVHAKLDAKRLKSNDTTTLEEIHRFMDLSKSGDSTNAHRMIFHHSEGCFWMERIFGINFEELDALRTKYNLPEEFIMDYVKQRRIDRESGTEILLKDNKKVGVRDIAESHVLSDFRYKFIPSLKDYTKHLEVQSWMNNALKPIDNELDK